MKKYLALVLLLLSCPISVLAQEDSTAVFKPSGEVIVRSFFDYSTSFGKEQNESGFDITRAFLGYKYQIAPTLSGQVIIDAASGKKDDRFDAYLRNAFVSWKDKGFEVNVGLIGLLQFSMQERYWKHRYVLRSFQDEYSMAPSVDLGVTGQYTFNKYLSADLSFTNGTGYKDVRKNDSKRYGAGLSLSPLKNTVFRIYTDVYNESEGERASLPEGVIASDYKNQYTLSLFAGYQIDCLSFGAEYNRVYNKGFIEKKDYYGYSFYTSVKVQSKWRVFGRYDHLNSKKPTVFADKWSKEDGQTIIAGVEFQPFKQLKIAPNFRNLNPERKDSEQYLFINIEFGL